jgi:hypothetical protein
MRDHSVPPDDRHLTEEALLAWVDERTDEEGVVRDHLEACGECRDRLEALEGLFTAVREAPPELEEEEWAARRDRIVEAVREQPLEVVHVTPIRTARRIPLVWWGSVAAAAVVAIVLLRPDAPPPGAPPVPIADRGAGVEEPLEPETALPIVAAAETAAEAAFAETGLDEALTDESVDLAGVDPSELSLFEDQDLLDDAALVSTSLEEEFAALSIEDQEEILEELAATAFEL